MELPTHIGAECVTQRIPYQETARFIRGSERMHDFERVLQSLGLELEVVVAASGSPVVGETIEAVEQQAARAYRFSVRRPGATNSVMAGP